MSAFRRKLTATDAPESQPEDAPVQQREQHTRSRPPPPPAFPAHIERALIAVTTKMQSVVERLDVVEHRVDELHESAVNAPSHGDVLEVRLHSAKLAAELARATVELRGEIGIASEQARRAARTLRNQAAEGQANAEAAENLEARAGIEAAEQLEAAKRDWSASA